MAYNPNLYNPYAQQSVNGLIRVMGADGAGAYPLPPNSAMPLFDANEDILYVKTTDGAGFATIKTYRFEEVGKDTEKAAEYVSRAEFDKLMRKVDNLSNQRRNHGKQPVSEQQQ